MVGKLRFKFLEFGRKETPGGPADSRTVDKVSETESGIGNVRPLTFTRALEKDGEIPLDTSDRIVPYHVCRSCGGDNPEGVKSCQTCEAEIGGPGQREYDLEVFHRRERDNEQTIQNLEEQKAAIDAREEQQKDLVEIRRRENIEWQKKTRPWRIALAVLGLILGVAVPILLIVTIRNGRYFYLITLVPLLLFLITIIRHIGFEALRNKSMYRIDWFGD